MTWQKGQSGNPVGPFSAKEAALKRRLQGLTFKAVDAIERILNDEGASHGERLAAAKEVFDRAIGKPKQQSTVEVTHNASPHLNALVNMAAAVALRGTNVPSIDAQPFDIIEHGTYEPQKLPLNVDAETAQHDDE